MNLGVGRKELTPGTCFIRSLLHSESGLSAVFSLGGSPWWFDCFVCSFWKFWALYFLSVCIVIHQIPSNLFPWAIDTLLGCGSLPSPPFYAVGAHITSKHATDWTIHCSNHCFTYSSSFKGDEGRKEHAYISLALSTLTFSFSISGFLPLFLWIHVPIWHHFLIPMQLCSFPSPSGCRPLCYISICCISSHICCLHNMSKGGNTHLSCLVLLHNYLSWFSSIFSWGFRLVWGHLLSA